MLYLIDSTLIVRKFVVADWFNLLGICFNKPKTIAFIFY
jgi:hypothetical protein